MGWTLITNLIIRFGLHVLAPARVVLIMWCNKLNTRFLRKKTVYRTGLECLSRFKFKPGVSVFLCQSEICCFVRCSECWASFLTSVLSAGIHQQFPPHKHIHQHFFDTKATPARLSSLKRWSTRLLNLSLCSTSLWHAVAFQRVSGCVSWGNRDPEYFLCSCTQTLVSAWSWPCAMNIGGCKQGWELLETTVVFSFILSEGYYFPVKSRARVKCNHSCSNAAVRK